MQYHIFSLLPWYDNLPKQLLKPMPKYFWGKDNLLDIPLIPIFPKASWHPVAYHWRPLHKAVKMRHLSAPTFPRYRKIRDMQQDLKSLSKTQYWV